MKTHLHRMNESSNMDIHKEGKPRKSDDEAIIVD